MAQRSFSREQVYLLPPSFDDWLPADHPVRYVAAFVDALDADAWQTLGIDLAGAATGAPAYHPRLLLSVWLAGFMSGVRSARGLEAACRDQVSLRWLSGNQTPDHNTLWRFWARHRTGMRALVRLTVRTAIRAGLVDLALVAVDGTKVSGNAARERTHDAASLTKLLARVEAALSDLEAQNVGESTAEPPRLPVELTRLGALKTQIETALATVTADDGPRRVNLTDADAVLLPTRHGWVAGYNAQAAVVATRPAVLPSAPLPNEALPNEALPNEALPNEALPNEALPNETTTPAPAASVGGGRLIVAVDVIANASDADQLLPLVAAATAALGQAPTTALADGGYHSGATLAGCQDQPFTVVMPEAQTPRLDDDYHKDRFVHDPVADTYTCPHGATLTFRGETARTGRATVRLYRIGDPVTCRDCPACGTCTRDTRHGRSIETGAHEALLRQHRDWMATAAAQALSRRRKTLPEPVFGILKECQGLRRFLLRGLDGVQSEWALLATAFNLRTLARAWQRTLAAPTASAPLPPRTRGNPALTGALTAASGTASVRFSLAGRI